MKATIVCARLLFIAAPLLLVGKSGGEAQAQQSPLGPPAQAAANQVGITATRLTRNADGSYTASGTVTLRAFAPHLGLKATNGANALTVRDGAGRLIATVPFDTASESVQVTDEGVVFTDKAGDKLTIKPDALPSVSPIYTYPPTVTPPNGARPSLRIPAPSGPRSTDPFAPNNVWNAQVVPCRAR